MASSVIFLCVTALSSLLPVLSSTLCSQEQDSFLYSLQSQCPPSISLNPPIQVDGNFIDKTLSSKRISGYTAILFHASLCPFSRSMYPAFEALSFMFPQIEHLAVEQASAMPSVFSRYGIHSVPTMLMVNQTSWVRYRGPKDLHSLVHFYEKTTGLEPVYYFDYDRSLSSESCEKSISQSMSSLLFKEISKREPYIVFSVLFLCFRVFLSLFPRALYCLKAFSASYIPHFNLGIFGETRQIMGYIHYMIDVRRIWTKLRLCKTGNLHQRAKNARVWASLASVSLGKSSSARSS